MKLHLRNVLPECRQLWAPGVERIYNAVIFFNSSFISGALENVPDVMYDIHK